MTKIGMDERNYSAGAVKLSFWFAEFRKVVQLLNSGKTMGEIKILNESENIFGAPTEARAKQIFTTISRRVRSLDKSFYEVFEKSDVCTQKLINLVAIMNTDKLFFDFVYEVYSEKLIIGNKELTDSDIRMFFNEKQIQSEKVAKWQDYTLKRLGGCYKTMLMEAGLIEQSTGNRKILKPLIYKSLEECLIEDHMEIMIHALTGTR